MTDKQTGGPAFPSPYDDDEGMTLRDYFAAKAIPGLLAAELVGEYSNEHIADIAYRIADAMLEARDGKP